MARKDPRRVAAGKKAAATRRRNANKRSNAAKRGAKRRTARKNPSTPRKRRASSAPRKRRAPSRAPAKRRRRSARRNPTFDVMKVVREGFDVALPLGIFLFVGHKIANYGTAKDADGNVTQTLQQRVGPLFNIAWDLLAIWAVPRYLLKGARSKYARDFSSIAKYQLGQDMLALTSYAARRDWSFDNSKAIMPGAKGYPQWTDYLAPVQIRAKAKALNGPLAGYGQRQIGAMRGAPPALAGPLAARYGAGRMVSPTPGMVNMVSA